MYRSRQMRKWKRKVTCQKTKRQTGRFLNRYDFAYAGRDTVNQAAEVAPDVIKTTTNKINNIAQQRTNQIISQEGKEIECVLPKIFRGAVEDVYLAPFSRKFWKDTTEQFKKQNFKTITLF